MKTENLIHLIALTTSSKHISYLGGNIYFLPSTVCPPKKYTFWNETFVGSECFITILNPRARYFSIVIRHSNSDKGLISKGILFYAPVGSA